MVEINSHNQVSKAVTKPLTPIVSGSKEKFNLTLTEDLLDKIKYLCKEFPNQEWSGVLFYKAEGDVSDVSTLTMEAFDLYPLDLGTATYTEFHHSADFAGYMARHPELMDSLQGLIHSHQSMPTFFSGTDTATLQEMSPVYNNYLSLIVNNAGVYTAAIGVHTVVESTAKEVVKYKGLDYTDKMYNTNNDKTREVVLKFDANIIKQNVTYNNQEFIESVEELKVNEKKQSYNKRVITPSLNNSSVFPVSKSLTKAVQSELFTEFKTHEAGNITNQMTEFLCKVAAQNYFYEADENRSFEANLLLAMSKIPKTLSHQKYSQLIYDSIDVVFNFMDINSEDEQSEILIGVLNGLKPLAARSEYYNELFECMDTYFIQINEDEDEEGEGINTTPIDTFSDI